MPFYTYIHYSPSADKFYIGHTGDMENRLRRHNNSGSKSTQKAADWELKYKREFSNEGA
jgi:putative endonuclease